MDCLNKMVQTPSFIIHENEMLDNLNNLKSSLKKYWGNYIIGYSYKTNAFPWLISFFDSNGCYAEVVSDDEYHLAKSIGARNLIYNGVAKTKDTFLEAIRNHDLVNIDSSYEIEWLGDLYGGSYGVGIRANFDLETKCPRQTQCGTDGERFGFCYENGELKKAIEAIQAKGVSVIGLHLHKSSNTRMPDIYRAISEAAVEIAEKYNLKLKYVDIGGGFFGGLSTKPQFDEYFDLVSGILKHRFIPQETALVVEPGMALIGAYVSYITKVLDVKKNLSCVYVCTDGSRIQIDPLMTKSTYFMDVHRIDDNRLVLDRQVISGFTCMEHDRLFEMYNKKALLPGDIIIYHKVGAYTMCLTPLFIKWFPNVYVKQGNDIQQLRIRWTDREYKANTL